MEKLLNLPLRKRRIRLFCIEGCHKFHNFGETHWIHHCFHKFGGRWWILSLEPIVRLATQKLTKRNWNRMMDKYGNRQETHKHMCTDCIDMIQWCVVAGLVFYRNCLSIHISIWYLNLISGLILVSFLYTNICSMHLFIIIYPLYI